MPRKRELLIFDGQNLAVRSAKAANGRRILARDLVEEKDGEAEFGLAMKS